MISSLSDWLCLFPTLVVAVFLMIPGVIAIIAVTCTDTSDATKEQTDAIYGFLWGGLLAVAILVALAVVYWVR